MALDEHRAEPATNVLGALRSGIAKRLGESPAPVRIPLAQLVLEKQQQRAT
jgi:hypothetical protein